jgi:iron-sulfur cluster repair protein YtfE (RIC family)
MKRHRNLIPYSQEHHQVLVLAQVLKTDVPDYKGMPTDLEGKSQMAIDYYERIIRDHEKKEEEFLFPVIVGRDPEIDQLVNQLVEEHREMDALMDRIRERPGSKEELNEIGIRLEKHVRKEERTLFELIQEKLGEEELGRISS